MTRFADHIIAQPPAPPPWLSTPTPAWRTHHGMLGKLLPHIPVLVADRAAEFLYAESDQEVWDFLNFPALQPPFPAFWVEYGRPSRVHSREYGDQASDAFPSHVGLLFVAQRQIPPRGHPSRARWLLAASLYLDVADRPLGPLARVRFQLDKRGTPITRPECFTWCDDRTRAEAALKSFAPFIYPALQALSWLNTGAAELEAAVPPEEVSNAYRQQHGHPLVPCQVLRLRQDPDAMRN
jgi:hypothetical protein